MLCAWCRAWEASTKDHVFPASIGGTKELALPACLSCQKRIRHAEEELARRSEFAIHRGGRDFKPKNLKSDPASGAVEAVYLLRAIEGDGYAEVAAQGGQARALPSIEIDLKTGQGRTRGIRSDIERLIEALIDAATKGAVISYDWFSDLEVPSDVAADPEFWPRVLLDLGGGLHVRARDEAEGEACLNILLTAAREGVFSRPEFNRNKEPWMVPPGTPHLVVMQWDERLVLRVIAKIAYGVASDQAGHDFMARDPFPFMRRYVLGDDEGPLAKELLPAGTIPDWPDHHVAAVHTAGGRVFGLVSLYGSLHMVDLGPAPDPNPWRVPAAVRCTRWAPPRVERLSAEEARKVMETLGGYAAGVEEDDAKGPDPA